MSTPEKTTAHVVEPGDGQTRSFGPMTVVRKLGADHGAGFSLIEVSCGPQTTAPPVPHWHTREHATFYVLEGALRIGLEDREVDAPAGTFVLLPPGAAFVWSNPHDAPARFLSMYAPAGFERFFDDVASAVAAEPDRPMPEAMREIIPPLWDAYGIRAE